MNKEAYLCLSAMLRAREGKMLSADRAARMLEAQSFEESVKLLGDCGYEDMTSMNAGEIDAAIQDVYERFPRLKERYKQPAGTLSGGEQQMLAMGRALMSRPKLLMLDEPSMGLAPILVKQIFGIVRELHQAGTTILLVEQNAQMALSVADRAYVLETGTIAMSGSAKELLIDERVRKAYLGG